MNDKTKIYLAAPLFSVPELEFNLTLVLLLQDNCPGVEIFLPQKIEYVNSEQIFEACRQGVLEADIVLAVLDGADADSGTAWECGYAYAQATPVVALRTDIRQSGDSGGFNAMLLGCAVQAISGQHWKQELIDCINQLVKVLNN